MDTPQDVLWCSACQAVCGHDWRECWAHARVHGKLFGADWVCEGHAADRRNLASFAHPIRHQAPADVRVEG